MAHSPLLLHLAVAGDLGWLLLIRAPKLHTLEIGGCPPKGFPKYGIIQTIRSASSQLSQPCEWILRPTTLICQIPTTIEDLTWFLGDALSIQSLTIKVDPQLKSELCSWLLSVAPKEQAPLCGRIRTEDGDGLEYQETPQYVQKLNICPNLVSLTLSLEWPQRDTDYWTHLSRKILGARSTNGATLESITFEWSDGNKLTRRVEECQ